ncbi:unnamed protein product, partial [Polarella glacialis]
VISRGSDDLQGEISALRMLTAVHTASGQWGKAAKNALKAVTVARQLGNPEEQCGTLVLAVSALAAVIRE